MIPLLAVLGKTVLVTAGLLLPGAGWALAWRWPLPWFAAGVISALAIFTGVVGFAILGVPITFLTLAAWLLVVTAAGGWFWSQRGRHPGMALRPSGDWWIALPALPMLAVALWRAITQPLSGADVDFRWNYLAELVVGAGHMDFYPPVSATAFTSYFWADGIAPLVSSVYIWTYLAAGSTVKTWTAIPVLLQFSALLGLLHALGRWWGGARGGWFACALGGSTMLLQFSFGLGQETGFTALGAAGLWYYLLCWQRERRSDLIVPAAGCAALAACAREYGLIFVFVSVGWLLLARASWRQLAGFALAAAVLPAVWYLRNWAITGNPVYAQGLGGLFPTNPIFDAWMKGYVRIYGEIFSHAAGWRELGRLFVIGSVPALFGLLAGTVLWRKSPGWPGGLAIVLAAAGAWVVSIPFTAGGLFYSMRVLSPLLAIGCACGGAALARWIPGRTHLAGLMVGLAVFSADASLRAWTIPINPYTIPSREWPGAGYRLQTDFARNDLPFIEAVIRAVPGRVLSESAGVQHLFHRQGRELVPLWSPEIAFLFSPDFHGDAIERLRAQGFSHILLTRSEFSSAFLGQTGVLRHLEGRVTCVMANETFALFVLEEKPGEAPAAKP